MGIEMREPGFAVDLPDGWRVEADLERYYAISTEPPGLLCITPELVKDMKSLPNLSRMLAGYLTRTGQPVASDELRQLNGIPGAQGFWWQYSDRQTVHRLWIVGNETRWILMTFTTAEENMGYFHPLLQECLNSLRLEGS